MFKGIKNVSAKEYNIMSKNNTSKGNNTHTKHRKSMEKVAKLGNGEDGELSNEQKRSIKSLYERVAPYREKLEKKNSLETYDFCGIDDDKDYEFCDHETCRRYLVARNWDIDLAEKQLRSTFVWRMGTEFQRKIQVKEFWQSSKAIQKPDSLNMRVIGLDKAGRPIIYTCFAEGHDRWDIDANTEHLTLLLESCCKLLHQRRIRNLNTTAAERQWIIVVDFDGFTLRDQSPKSLIMFTNLMQHYPEMLNMIFLLNAPQHFTNAFGMIKTILDDRVNSKIIFVKGIEEEDDDPTEISRSKEMEKMKRHIGYEAVDWLRHEILDNRYKRIQAETGGGQEKKYWEQPLYPTEHDPRGMKSYIESSIYIETPGDAFVGMN